MSINLRIATFNLENLDDKPTEKPTLRERIAVMRPQLQRLNADILCLQEVNGQEEVGQPRRLLALQKLIEGTPYANFYRASTITVDKRQVYDERNLVILSRFEILDCQQYKHQFAPPPIPNGNSEPTRYRCKGCYMGTAFSSCPNQTTG